MAVILFINFKGGVAKTTNAVAVAECLASMGKRTLLIDADHQCMAGELLLGEEGQMRSEKRRTTLHDLLAAMLDDEFSARQFNAFLQPAVSAPMVEGEPPTLMVLPCSSRIEDFSTNMAKAKKGYHDTAAFHGQLAKRKAYLRKWLDESFDYTLIDCPPSMALQVRTLMSVADSYVIPCVPDRLAVRGAFALMDRIRQARHRIQPLGTLWSMYRVQVSLHKKIVIHAAQRQAPLDVLPEPFFTVIPNATKIAESAEPEMAHLDFRQKYSPQIAQLYEKLCLEILERLGRNP